MFNSKSTPRSRDRSRSVVQGGEIERPRLAQHPNRGPGLELGQQRQRIRLDGAVIDHEELQIAVIGPLKEPLAAHLQQLRMILRENHDRHQRRRLRNGEDALRLRDPDRRRRQRPMQEHGREMTDLGRRERSPDNSRQNTDGVRVDGDPAGRIDQFTAIDGELPDGIAAE